MKYHIITYGCQMNEADSKKIASLLKSQRHKPVEKIDEADLVVINACSVRQSAMHRVYDKINKYHKDKKIILAGCVLESDKKKFKDKIYQFWHPDHYFYCQSIREPLSDHSKDTALVSIMTGCDNFCSYCVVPYTRGREKSRPADEIIKEIKNLIKNGLKEILLMGQNVNSYHSSGKNSSSEASAKEDKFISFPKLLHLLNALPGNFTIKFLSSHPKDMSDELIDAIANLPKISKDVHLPMQSGDNEILKKMNRGYTVEYYLGIVKKLRKKVKGIRLSTDIIVGFPGETEKQFENTISAFKKAKFDHAFIAMYSLRPGTAAARMKDDVPLSEKRRRHKLLFDLF